MLRFNHVLLLGIAERPKETVRMVHQMSLILQRNYKFVHGGLSSQGNSAYELAFRYMRDVESIDTEISTSLHLKM